MWVFNTCTKVPQKSMQQKLSQILQYQTICRNNRMRIAQLSMTKQTEDEIIFIFETLAQHLRIYKQTSAITGIQILQNIYDITNEQQLKFRYDTKKHSPQQIRMIFEQKSQEFAERELLSHYVLKLIFSNSEQQIMFNYPQNMNKAGLLILNALTTQLKDYPKFAEEFKAKINRMKEQDPGQFGCSSMKNYWENFNAVQNINGFDFQLNNVKKSRTTIKPQFSSFSGIKEDTFGCYAKNSKKTTNLSFVSTEDDEQSLLQQIRKAEKKMKPKFQKIAAVIPKFTSIGDSQKESGHDIYNQEIEFVLKLINYVEGLFREYNALFQKYKTFEMGSNLTVKKLTKQKQELQEQIAEIEKSIKSLKKQNLMKQHSCDWLADLYRELKQQSDKKTDTIIIFLRQIMQDEDYKTRLIDRYEFLRRKLRDQQSRSVNLYNQLKASCQEKEELIQQMKLAKQQPKSQKAQTPLTENNLRKKEESLGKIFPSEKKIYFKYKNSSQIECLNVFKIEPQQK